MPNTLHIKVVMTINGNTFVSEHKGPLDTLGGDRRRWRSRIVDHVAKATAFVAERFAMDDVNEAVQRAKSA